jgi:hypothetical protein
MVIEGDAYAAVARALKNAEEKTLARELDKGFRTPFRELMPALAAAQFHVLPKRGGAAAAIRPRTTFGTRKVLRGGSPGMRLQAKQKGRIARQDQGVLRHPVFADPDKTRDEWKWVNQPIEKGWFSDVTAAAADNIRRSQEQALREVVAQIEVDMRQSGKGR